MRYDFAVVGGGIVGLATALELTRRFPGCSLLLLEKESGVACHQTGHNSGVIHAGIYYKPKSFKADLCTRGRRATEAFCAEHAIAFETRGKLVVAGDAAELARLEGLRINAVANGIAVEQIDAAELRRREPHVSGLGALFVPQTGIVDYRLVTETMARLVRAAGGDIRFGIKVDRLREEGDQVSVFAGGREFQASRAVACAGLQSDRLARRSGIDPALQIVPFRGEYYDVAPAKRDIVRHLIYPVPNPELPFLGVHLTPTVGGRLTVGPNAVLGFSREGYDKGALNARDIAQLAAFPGLWRLLRQNLRSAGAEMRDSLFKSHYLERVRRYCPDLRIEDLLPMQAGIRAQAVARDGALLHDFVFVERARILHVCNAPSPAATAALPIGAMIADRMERKPSRVSVSSAVA